MSYTLVINGKENGEEDAHLENPKGDIIAEYSGVPAHPAETAEDIAEDFSNNPQDMILFMLQQRWDFRIEQS